VHISGASGVVSEGRKKLPTQNFSLTIKLFRKSIDKKEFHPQIQKKTGWTERSKVVSENSFEVHCFMQTDK